MKALLTPKTQITFLRTVKTSKFSINLYSTSNVEEKICDVITSGVGSLDDLESTLNTNSENVSFSSSAVTKVIDCCKNEAPNRRLLRFFCWFKKKVDSGLCDEDFNHVIQVFAEKRDFTALEILLADLAKENRVLATETFGIVAEALVKLNREDEALGIFKNLEKFKCLQDKHTVTAIVNALCLKGHTKRAEGVVYHHRNAISGSESCVYKSLLYGWTVNENVIEARKVIKEMKSVGIKPDLYCFNTFLRCLCKRNLMKNPSGLVPEALNVMMEMRTYGILPTSISYNILLSNLAKTKRVKECLNILELMRKSGCAPDWVSYYLVARVLYLSGRFGKGNQIVEKMIEQDGLIPDRKFYYDLVGVLCAVQRPNYAVELFERMKRSGLGGYGPVYDLLIPKLCRQGEFVKGKELWDEAVAMGVELGVSSDVLVPSVSKVLVPRRKTEDCCTLESVTASKRVEAEVPKTSVKKKMKYENKRRSCNKKNKRKSTGTK